MVEQCFSGGRIYNTKSQKKKQQDFLRLFTCILKNKYLHHARDFFFCVNNLPAF